MASTKVNIFASNDESIYIGIFGESDFAKFVGRWETPRPTNLQGDSPGPLIVRCRVEVSLQHYQILEAVDGFIGELLSRDNCILVSAPRPILRWKL